MRRSRNEDEAPLHPHQIISFSVDPASPSSSIKGVEIPLFLQDLFGLDFLPRRQENVNNDTETVSARQQDSASDDTPSELSLEDEPIFDGIDLSEVKKKRRSVSALASRMKQARQVRKQRKRNVEKQDDKGDGNINNSQTTNNIKSQVNETWVQKQQQTLKQHKAMLASVQQETQEVETRAKNLSAHVSLMQQQVAELEVALSQSIASLDEDTRLLKQSKRELKKLEHRRNKAAGAVQETAAAILSRASSRPPRGARPRDNDPDLSPMVISNVSGLDEQTSRRRAESAPPVLLRKQSSSFIRVHDLDMDTASSLSTSGSSSTSNQDAAKVFFLDNDVNTVLNALAKFGYELATDESDRFVAALNTEKLKSQYANVEVDLSSWPFDSWQAPQGKDVLVWTGSVDHNGFGCDLPVIKARATIPATPLQVLDLVMDSSRAMEYNKMSQGRTDLLMLQEGIETQATESAYGVAGEIKVIKSLNKPPLLRRTIEMVSLIYARPLEDAEGYLAVNRSLWEDSSATLKQTKDTVRSEMILGVNVFRPVPGINDNETYCELTTIAHAHAPIVPDAIARKMGPTQAVAFLRQVQDIFATKR